MTRNLTGMRRLGEFCTKVTTIKEVVAALGAIRDASAADVVRPDVDGISAFSRLYTIITQNVLDTVEGRKPARAFTDPAFLTMLDVEFAKRYLNAIHAWETEPRSAPRAWRVLFDRRRAPGIRHVNFAAAGVNAHVNFDLTYALLETWKTFPPNRARRKDYNAVNDIFAEEMDELREDFEAFLTEDFEDGSPVDKLGNVLSGVLVTWTRAAAWWAATWVWRHYDPLGHLGGRKYQKAYDRMHRRQDRVAQALGWAVLKAPRIP
ncbi:DUF5995 family protein [Pseudonocardia sp. RS010]|uniref:DUF5995 family protein n=1 Tax=Pseudonocardia sp. RS010 TaxID=3385979 RepID=UPI0039A37433